MRNVSIKTVNSVCMECGKRFIATYTYGVPRLCSDVCKDTRKVRSRDAIQKRYRQKNYHPPQPRNCILCGGLYTPNGTRSDSKYCSLKCCLRGNQITRTYGITVKEFNEMVVRQHGICAACGYSFNDDTPHIDHDHRTGTVRGLIHRECNAVLGFVDDDIDRLKKLIIYLEKK